MTTASIVQRVWNYCNTLKETMPPMHGLIFLNTTYCQLNDH